MRNGAIHPCTDFVIVHIRFLSYATAVVLQIAYGHEITSDEDPFLQNAHALDRLFARFVNAGSSAVDFFPACEPPS